MRKAIVLAAAALFMVSGAALAECGGHSTSASAPSQPVVTGTSTPVPATVKETKG